MPYTAHRFQDTVNGWLVKNTETEEEEIVFCKINENTEEDAIAVLEDAISNREIDPSPDE